MTIAKFEKMLPLLKIGKADREYFLRWIKRYSGFNSRRTGQDYHHREELPVTSEGVIKFSQELRDSKTPAWQRLQAVRAVEAYRDAVLGTEDPTLTHITSTLNQIAIQKGTPRNRPPRFAVRSPCLTNNRQN